MSRRGPADGMKRDNSAGRRDTVSQVPGPHTAVRCERIISRVSQPLGKHYYAPLCSQAGGREANGHQERSCTEGLTVTPTQGCQGGSHLDSSPGLPWTPPGLSMKA